MAWTDDLAPVAALTAVERTLLERQLERNIACVPTTSMGRLFDAVASLIDLRHDVTFEAQAAIDLEHAAGRAHGHGTPLAFHVAGGVIDPRPLVRGIVDHMRKGVAPSRLALGFPHAVADAVAALAGAVRRRRGVDVVALSGGVFQTALHVELCARRLAGDRITCLTHRLVPPNDGGRALGQAYVAAHRRRGAPDTLRHRAFSSPPISSPPINKEY